MSSSDLFAAYWLIIAAVLFIGGMFYLGFHTGRREIQSKYNDGIDFGNIVAVALLAIIWPVVVIFFPFWCILQLGRVIGKLVYKK